AKSKTILVFINQIRMKIGVMFGNPETTTGGNALKFYASVRLEVRKIETIDKGADEDAIGNKVRVKVVKNKVAPPFRKVEMEIMFGKGVSRLGSLIDAAVKYNVVDKKGAWYTWGEEKIGQGRDNVKIYLEQNPDLADELERKLRQLIFGKKDEAAGDAKPGAGKAAPARPEAGARPRGETAAETPPARPVGRPPAAKTAAAKPSAGPSAGPSADDEGLF
ncbi:MAG TPA: recombinase RecA, partial [Spirochaetia bacterium]|nr:recombinase RecA [Spirochaetia bacterium]